MENRDKQRENYKMKQMESLIANSVSDHRQKLLSLKQDHQKLLEDCGISITSDALKKLNTIDMTNFLSPAIQECIDETSKFYTDSEYNKLTIVPSVFISKKMRSMVLDLSKRNTFFHYIPCFEEGTIKINKKAWIYFKILNLDIDNQILDIKLQLYKREYLDGGFVLCLSSMVRHELVDGQFRIKQNKKESLSPSEVYMIKTDEEHKAIGWSDSDLGIWKNVIVKSRSKTELKNQEYVRDHSFIELTTSAEQAEVEVLFSSCIQIVNELMEKETLSKAKKTKESKKNVVNKPIDFKDNSTFIIPSDKRKVRTLGSSGIDIVSEKVPRTPNAQYVRHYSVSSWTQAGHIRHMKSGKTIYIKPQTKHRHALSDKNIELPQKQTTLKIESDISLD